MVSKYTIGKNANMKLFSEAESTIDSYIKNEEDVQEINYLLDQRLEIKTRKLKYVEEHSKLAKLYEQKDMHSKKIAKYMELYNSVKEKQSQVMEKDKEAKKTLSPNKTVTPYFTELVMKLNTVHTMKHIINNKKQELKAYKNNILQKESQLSELREFATYTDIRIKTHKLDKLAEEERINRLIHNYDEFD